MPAGKASAGSALLIAIGAAQAAIAAAAPSSPTLALPPLDASTSLLVVAPHPDDETLCCGGLIQRVVHAGGRVSIVWVTSGDASELDLLLLEKQLFATPESARALAARRMREARAAANALGVPPTGQLFLGYPDRGLIMLLTANRLRPYTSRFTGAAAVPYPEALYAGHPYTGESLERDLAAVLERVRPTLVLAPSPLDSHPDHRAAGLLAISVSTRSGQLASLRYWIVHGGEGWPSPRELLPGVPLTPAPRLGALPYGSFALEPNEEDRKLEALRAYDTQMQVMAPFLLAFVRTTELFAAEPQPSAALR